MKMHPLQAISESLIPRFSDTPPPPTSAIGEAEAALKSATAKRDEIAGRLHRSFADYERLRLSAVERAGEEEGAELAARARGIEVLEAALRQAGDAVTAAQAALKTARDEECERAARARCLKQADVLVNAVGDFRRATENLKTALTPVGGANSQEAIGFLGVLRDFDVLLTRVIDELRRGAATVSEPPVEPAPKPPAPKLLPSIPMMTVVPTRSFRWTQDGETKFASPGWDTQAPNEVAKRALRLGFACEPGSQKGREARAARRGLLPDIDAVDLTDEPLPEALQPKTPTFDTHLRDWHGPNVSEPPWMARRK